jgi:hypothetical protein
MFACLKYFTLNIPKNYSTSAGGNSIKNSILKGGRFLNRSFLILEGVRFYMVGGSEISKPLG